MSKLKHRRAIKATAIVAIVGFIPICILMYFHLTKHEIDLENFGVVPEFAYTFTNDPVGITHHDTERHPVIVAVLKDSCAASSESTNCEAALRKMNQLKDWLTKHVLRKLPNVINPPPMRLIAMGEGIDPERFEGWQIVEMSENMPYLVPDVRKDGPYPAIVVIDDSSFFRAYIPVAEPDALDKAKAVINQVVSYQYLMHYVGQQMLMWEKYKGRSKSATH